MKNLFAIGPQGGNLKQRALGDGLAPLDSALGRHADPVRALCIPKRRLWAGQAMNHMDLLNRAEAYATLRRWLA